MRYFRTLFSHLPATRRQVNELKISVLSIHSTLELVLMNQAEQIEKIKTLTAQNEKAAAEQAKALQKLKEAVDAAGASSPELDAAFAELEASIQREDDLNPDTPAGGETPTA